MDLLYKEVYFDKFCNKCRWQKRDENAEDDKMAEPCHTCLNNTVNLYSHRPVKWEAK